MPIPEAPDSRRKRKTDDSFDLQAFNLDRATRQLPRTTYQRKIIRAIKKITPEQIVNEWITAAAKIPEPIIPIENPPKDRGDTIPYNRTIQTSEGNLAEPIENIDHLRQLSQVYFPVAKQGWLDREHFALMNFEFFDPFFEVAWDLGYQGFLSTESVNKQVVPLVYMSQWLYYFQMLRMLKDESVENLIIG